MAQPFFHDGQHIRVATGLSDQQPVGRQAGLRKARREQVAAGDDPQHGSALPRPPPGDAGQEQGGGGVIAIAIAGPRNLMEAGIGQAATGELHIQCIDAERQRRCGSFAPRNDGAHLAAQTFDMQRPVHADSTLMFY